MRPASSCSSFSTFGASTIQPLFRAARSSHRCCSHEGKELCRVGITDRYRGPSDLPEVLPVFPLRGAILLPRATLALNVFEPRYLELVEFALGNGRFLAVVQPAPEAGDTESPPGKTFPLRRVGCAGRITSFNEADDG